MLIPRARRTGLLAIVWTALGASPVLADVTECSVIASLPAVISQPGVYCLKQNVAFSSGGPAAISIETNNVTLDCNNYRISGRPVGSGIGADGVFAKERSRITVRNCSIVGFRGGIVLYGNENPGSGHLVEDNLLHSNGEWGIFVTGAGSIVRGNRVIDTGGKPGSVSARAISVTGDAIDNVVDDVHGADDVPDFQAEGVYAGTTSSTAVGVLVERNRVRNLVPRGASEARAIDVRGYGVMVRENVVAQTAPTRGQGVYCGSEAVLVGNLITGFAEPVALHCRDAGGNVTP